MSGKLILVPTPIGAEAVVSLPSATIEAARRLKFFFAEEPKTLRAFLKSIEPHTPLQQIQITKFDQKNFALDTKLAEEILSAGNDLGYASEAGCPCLADPGNILVRWCHKQNISVVPLIGPSSIVLALMASGLNGQNFSFLGYLPADSGQRKKKLSAIDALVQQTTQIFIETPYRNDALLEDILSTCSPNTILTVALGLTTEEQTIRSEPISGWRKKTFKIGKVPAIFLLGS